MRVSAWSKAVTIYVEELTDDFESSYTGLPVTKERLLNGASSWSEYSYGGCSLIYDTDIAERTCCPSELKKTRGGERNPNGRETWLDVQTRALSQACRIVLRKAGKL